MNNNVYNTFINVIENLKKNQNVKSIIHVGSSKDKIYKEDCEINDIDLFVIVEKQEKAQIRSVETINNLEFDFNYISIESSYSFIQNKTYFFLKIKDGNILYDVDDIGKNILVLCEEEYKKGPEKITLEEKLFQVKELNSDISRLENKNEYEDFEYDFLIYMYLNQIVKMYYLINDMWIPKDKKLLKSLKKDNRNLYNLICCVRDDEYEGLRKVTDYAFKNL